MPHDVRATTSEKGDTMKRTIIILLAIVLFPVAAFCRSDWETRQDIEDIRRALEYQIYQEKLRSLREERHNAGADEPVAPFGNTLDWYNKAYRKQMWDERERNLR